MDKTNLKLKTFCRFNKQQKRSKGNTWSRGTNPQIAVNLTLNLSN